MSLAIIAAQGSGPSASMLRSMLETGGIDVRLSFNGHQTPLANKLVYWGLPGRYGPEMPSLNCREPVDKLAELGKLAAGGVNVPLAKTELVESDFSGPFLGPWYARKLEHHGGNDLRVVLSTEESQWRRAAGWNFFTLHVPIKRELRAWGFRGKYLATYEKVMAYPEQYQRYGRNHRNGFAFRRVTEGRPEGLKEMMNAALIALGLDFGALDVIESPDGTLTALEVNTAPGISDVNMGGAKKLAQCIKEWYDSL